VKRPEKLSALPTVPRPESVRLVIRGTAGVERYLYSTDQPIPAELDVVSVNGVPVRRNEKGNSCP
jgi:hypothetical protein